MTAALCFACLVGLSEENAGDGHIAGVGHGGFRPTGVDEEVQHGSFTGVAQINGNGLTGSDGDGLFPQTGLP